MKPHARLALRAALPFLLLASACGSSSDTDGTAIATATSDDAVTRLEDTAAEYDTATGSAPDSDDAAAAGEGVDAAALFDDGVLTADAEVVDCTLENGSETTCYQVEVASLSSTVDTDGSYCPDTVDDSGGIWVWDGGEPGLYALDADFWALMEAQGYEFVDSNGNVSITDPAAGRRIRPAPPTRVWRPPPTAPSTSRC